MKTMCIILTMLLAGCSNLTITKTFAEDEVIWSKNIGFNEVVGVSSVRIGSNQYFCDGTMPVILVPYSEFAKNKIELLSGKELQDSNKIAFNEDFFKKRIQNDSQEANKFNYHVTCSNGRFIFSGIPDGKWFLITHVIVKSKPITGYFFVNKVETANNKTVIITNEVTEDAK